MVYKKIHDDLYGVDLLFFSGCPIEIVQKKANRVFNIQEELIIEKDEDCAFFTCTTKEDKHVYIIWCNKSRNISNIAHEVVHLVFEIFKDRGIPNTYQNQEAFSYYLTFWLQQILNRG